MLSAVMFQNINLQFKRLFRLKFSNEEPGLTLAWVFRPYFFATKSFLKPIEVIQQHQGSRGIVIHSKLDSNEILMSWKPKLPGYEVVMMEKG